YDTTLTLKDPSTAPPTGCSYQTSPYQFLECSGANVTINGFDFSLHNGIFIEFTTCSGTATISNNKVVMGTTQNTTSEDNLILFDAGTCNIVLNQNEISGGAPTFQVVQVGLKNLGSGTITETYNYCHGFGKGCLQVAGTLNANVTERYN